MNAFPRLIPYVWPHRRKFYLSVVFSLLVAGLWGLSLSSAYPIVTVLFENKSVEQYVDDAIATTKAVIEKKEKTLDEREDQLKKLDDRKEPHRRILAPSHAPAVDRAIGPEFGVVQARDSQLDQGPRRPPFAATTSSTCWP